MAVVPSSLFRLLAGVLSAAGGLVIPAVTWGQADPRDGDTPVAKPAVSLDVRSLVSQVHAPGRWSQLQVRIANARDEPFAGLTTTALGASGALQYGRRVLVPPHARLITWQPFLVPDASRPESEAEGIQELEYQSLLLDEESTSERLMRDEFGSLRIQDTIWLARPGPVTGIVEPPGSSFKSIDPDVVTAANTVEASRLSHRRRHNFVHFEQGLPPGGEESLDGYDQLVIAADTVLHDADAVAAVRRWLFAGGRLWVMLDQADEGVLGALLGDEFDAQVVDRVGLTSVHIQSGAETTRVDEKPREFDKPVAFVRMLVDATPVFTVNGWPAAYWETYGAGRVLVTTLGPEAWVRRLSESERESEELVWRSDYAAGPALRRLTSTFYGPRPAPLLATAVLDAQAREYIGYSIPSRGLVVGMLGAFAAVLIALGVWLLRIGEAQRMAVFGALAALATSLALMGAGRLHRALPSTSALTQFVECLPGTNDVRLTGAAATYIADSGAVGFAGDRGGWLMPEMVGAGGTTHRLVWSEVDEWQWENLEQPPGLHAATFASAARFDDRVTATATFDANGLSGRLTLPAGKTASDALLVTALGRMGVTEPPKPDSRAAAGRIDEHRVPVRPHAVVLDGTLAHGITVPSRFRGGRLGPGGAAADARAAGGRNVDSHSRTVCVIP
jgi:hypothetical protein